MSTESSEKTYMRRSVEIAIRLTLVFMLVWYCFNIISPFISSLLWGIITAVALYPLFLWIKKKTGLTSIRTAVLITLLSLVVFAVPFYLLVKSLIVEFQFLATQFNNENFVIPDLPAGINEWPVIGKKIDHFWTMATKNIDLLLSTYDAEINSIGSWLLDVILSLIAGVFHFVLAIFFAGVFLAYSEQGSKLAHRLFIRMAGKQGEAFCNITEKTILSVTKGVLGVAVIQAALAGISFFLLGIPGAGIITLLCALLATMQIGLLPIIVPVMIYVVYSYSTLTAVLLGLWLIFVLALDNVLKPILLGKDAPVPMPVIFIGVIGGFISFGIVGMFIGSVIFSIGYILFLVWLRDDVDAKNNMDAS
jgi:predicted PurR-regulated permease PerM